MKIGIIDIGTNTTRLAVFDAEPHGARTPVLKKTEITRLGEDVNRTRNIKPEAAARTLLKLDEYMDDCRALGADRVAGAGTSVLRDAENAADFVNKVQERGVDFRVVTGAVEGRMVYAGVAAGLGAKPQQPVLVVDVGGGSTEFITGRGADFDRVVSLDIGAVRMTERFVTQDPPARRDLESLEAFVTSEFRKIAPDFAAAADAIMAAVGGTSSTLAALLLGVYDPERVHGMELSLDNVLELYRNLAAATTEQRAAMPGMEPKRADIITAGAGIYACMLRAFGKHGFRVSLHDIRHGLLEYVLSGRWDD